MTTPRLVESMRELATTLDRVDQAAYAAVGADPLEPVIGGGDRRCRVGVIGRDPGRQEIEYRQPFIGAGGQKLRAGLYRALHGAELPSFDASLQVGRHVFWANTVPYKPLGNKVWPKRVRDAFRPLITDLLVHEWDGRDILCMGRVAFDWFGHHRDLRDRLREHWARDDRFSSSVDVSLTATDGTTAVFHLHPLPHPSPLNATWAPHFPRLLDERLAALGLSTDTWRL